MGLNISNIVVDKLERAYSLLDRNEKPYVNENLRFLIPKYAFDIYIQYLCQIKPYFCPLPSDIATYYHKNIPIGLGYDHEIVLYDIDWPLYDIEAIKIKF
jgi:hypothetical protein